MDCGKHVRPPLTISPKPCDHFRGSPTMKANCILALLIPFSLLAQPNPEQARMRAEYAKTHPPRESTGLIPLTDLGKGDYKGEQGGLYPGGENVPPRAHLKAGLQIAK